MLIMKKVYKGRIVKKGLIVIISVILVFFAIGCKNNNIDSLPIIPDMGSSDVSTDNEESEENTGDESISPEDSSSENEENKEEKETKNWTGFY